MFASAVMLGDVVSASQFGGYIISMLGMLLYQHARSHPDLSLSELKSRLKAFFAIPEGSSSASHGLEASRTTETVQLIIK